MKHPVSLALGAIFLGAAALGLTACNQNGPPIRPSIRVIPIRPQKRIPSMRPTARPRSPS